MSKLDDILEMEARGILPPDYQADLNEARRRGLVPAREEQADGIRKKSPLTDRDLEAIGRLADDASDTSRLRREPSGQLIFTPERAGTIPFLGNPAAAVAAGVRNLAVGIATLPFDIGEALGSEYLGKISKGIKQNVPEIKTSTTIEGLTSAFVQYGIPATAALKLVGGMAAGVPSAIRYGLQLLAGGGSDLIVSTGEEGTLGDVPEKYLGYGGPTARKPGESALTTRAKIGAEGAIVPGILSGITRPFSYFGPTERAARVVRDKLSQAASRGAGGPEGQTNIERTIAEIEKAIGESAVGGFSPTTGTASNIPELIGLERGAATAGETSASFLARKAANMRAIREELEPLTSGVPGQPEVARSFFSEAAEGPVTKAEQTLTSATRKLESAKEDVSLISQAEKKVESAKEARDVAKVELENFISDNSVSAGKTRVPSEVIDKAVREDLNSLTKKKNDLAAAIDPENSVVVPAGFLRSSVISAMKKTSAGDMVPSQLPEPLMKSLFDISKPGAPPLTFRAVQDLRPTMSDAIKQARARDEGGVVKRLVAIKDTLDFYVEYVAQSGKGKAADAAREFVRFYRDEYAPAYRRYAGDAFRRAERLGRPFPPSETGTKFLLPATGAAESAEQLSKVISRSANPAEVSKAVRDHIIADVATMMQKANGRTAVDRLDMYMNDRQMREVLAKFPDVQRELIAYKNSLSTKKAGIESLEKGVEAAEKGLEAAGISRKESLSRIGAEIEAAKETLASTVKARNEGAARFFVDNEPVTAVGRALRSGDPEGAFRDLVNRAKTDKTGEALAGLKSALGEYINRTITTTTEIGTVQQTAKSALARLLDTPKTNKALSVLYTKDEMATIGRVRKQLDMMDRINQQVTSGSATAPLVSQEAQFQNFLTPLYLFATGGWSVIRARYYSGLTSRLLNVLGGDPQPMARAILADVMLNPDRAIMFLKRVTPITAKPMEDRIASYVVNNFAPERKRRDKTQSGQIDFEALGREINEFMLRRKAP